MAEELTGRYANVILSRTNEQVVRMAMMTERYFWHVHPNSDETFLGVEGAVILELEGEQIRLGPGQMFTVPMGVKHRTGPEGARSVNLTFERADMETVQVEEEPLDG